MLAIARATRKRSTLMSSTFPTAPPCPLWRRLTALVYDLLIVLAIMMVANMLGLLVTGGRLLDEQQHLRAWWFPLFEAACVGGYFVASWRRGGQTIGMRPWRIRLTTAAGDTPSWPQSLIRLGVAAAPWFLLGLTHWVGLRLALWAVLVAWVVWYIPALIDPRRRAVHDIVAGTEIRSPP
jgi:uncharacterized RDD family membrane protein YckC